MCLQKISSMFQGSLKGVSMKLQVCIKEGFRELSTVFQESSKGVQVILKGISSIFKGVSRV